MSESVEKPVRIAVDNFGVRAPAGGGDRALRGWDKTSDHAPMWAVAL